MSEDPQTEAIPDEVAAMFDLSLKKKKKKKTKTEDEAKDVDLAADHNHIK